MHKYLKDLRAAAGHIPILVCGASVLAVNARGEILLHRRRDNGCWAIPGGAVDMGEVVEDAARREFLEETGLSVSAMRLFGVYSGEDMRHVYPNGDEISNVDILFLTDDFAGDARADGAEGDEIGFFHPLALPSPISPPCVRELADYAAGIGKSVAFFPETGNKQSGM